MTKTCKKSYFNDFLISIKSILLHHTLKQILDNTIVFDKINIAIYSLLSVNIQLVSANITRHFIQLNTFDHKLRHMSVHFMYTNSIHNIYLAQNLYYLLYNIHKYLDY